MATLGVTTFLGLKCHNSKKKWSDSLVVAWGKKREFCLETGDLGANQILPLFSYATLTQLLNLPHSLSFLIGKTRKKTRYNVYKVSAYPR